MVTCAKRNGYQEIAVCGSEPTLYNELVPLMMHINKMGLGAPISTNGASFSALSYIRLFSQMKYLTIKISFHSHNKQIFDFLTNTEGSYEKVLSALDNISAHFKQYQNKNSFQRWLTVNIVINSYNYRVLPQTVSFLNTKGVRCIIFSNLSPAEKICAHHDLTIGLREMLPCLARAIACARQKGIFYLVNRLPICLLPSERDAFVPYRRSPGFKPFRYCNLCPYINTCYGIPRV